MVKNIWKKIILSKDKKIKDAIKRLNATELQIIIVVDNKNKFLGTVTDGDIRRGLIKGFNLNDQLIKIINIKSTYVSPSRSYEDAKILMKAQMIRHLPVVDSLKKVVGLHLLDEIINTSIPNKFVIMAGGFGKRLKPFTNKTPKPMLKIGNKPILEHIILNAKSNGFQNFIICVHYLHNKIIQYFKNGKKHEVKINYIHEKKPKGTAAGLKQIRTRDKNPILVTNGDIISNVNYAKILDYHNYNKSDATVVIRNISQKNPYGVVKLKNSKVIGFEEKKNFVVNINTGIYVLNPNVLKLLDKNKEDMPDFLNKLRKKNKKVIAYPIYENWIDIGTKLTFESSKRKFNYL